MVYCPSLKINILGLGCYWLRFCAVSAMQEEYLLISCFAHSSIALPIATTAVPSRENIDCIKIQRSVDAATAEEVHYRGCYSSDGNSKLKSFLVVLHCCPL